MYIVRTYLIHKLRKCVHTILVIFRLCTVGIMLIHLAGYSAAERVARSTDSADPVTSCPQMEVLRGRDGRDGSQGRDGRDGGKGETRDAGRVGATGRRGDKAQQDRRDYPAPSDRQGFLAPVTLRRR